MKFLLLLCGLALLWWLLRPRRARPGKSIELAEARRVLAVGEDADAEAIQDAHRRLIQRVHPDAGGTEELARRVNLARDTLLADIERRSVERC